MNNTGKGLKKIIRSICSWFKKRNPITITLLLGLLIYLTSGEYTLWNQWRYSRQIRQKKQEISRLEQEIAEAKKSLEALKYKDEALERYARERYQLKADDEDLYLLE